MKTYMDKRHTRFEEFSSMSITNNEFEGVKLFMEVEQIIKETEIAFTQLKNCISDYWKLEADASHGTKILMLMNGWHSPFEACNELVKRIETNEQILKNICKAGGTTLKKICYRAKSKEARDLLQTESSKEPLEA